MFLAIDSNSFSVKTLRKGSDLIAFDPRLLFTVAVMSVKGYGDTDAVAD